MGVSADLIGLWLTTVNMFLVHQVVCISWYVFLQQEAELDRVFALAPPYLFLISLDLN